MYPDIIAIGIPLMVGCVVVEFVYDLRRKVRNYRVNGALSNISCGIFEQLTGFISKGLFIAVYLYFYENWRVQTLDDTWWVWIALILLVDFVFYFFHRLSHHCSFLWAGHVVHHEAEEFNLTVALRRSVMQEFTIIWVYLPFAVAGFSPGAFFLVFAAHNLYQFGIHTRYAPELRVLGVVLNTPRHHELHHCRNQCYLDKNFAGVFIVWDKLFGTFATHTEAPEFGVDHETTTLNPVKAQISVLARVLAETRRRSGWRSKLGALFGPPVYLAAARIDSAVADAPRTARPKFDPQIASAQLRAAVISFGLLVVGTTAYRNFEGALSLYEKVAVLVVFVAVLFHIGSILDDKTSAWRGRTRSDTRLG